MISATTDTYQYLCKFGKEADDKIFAKIVDLAFQSPLADAKEDEEQAMVVEDADTSHLGDKDYEASDCDVGADSDIEALEQGGSEDNIHEKVSLLAFEPVSNTSAEEEDDRLDQQSATEQMDTSSENDSDSSSPSLASNPGDFYAYDIFHGLYNSCLDELRMARMKAGFVRLVAELDRWYAGFNAGSLRDG
ncbi:MAG: hypothetical protein Q9188_003342 [Gyalolechia gomerana]